MTGNNTNNNLQAILDMQIVRQDYQTSITKSQVDIGYLFDRIKKEENAYFFNQKIKELNVMYQSLGFQNESVLEIGIDIVNNCISQNKTDIKISRTGENELLIFRERNGDFNNVIIDEDADIELLQIPVDRSNTTNEHYPFVYYTNIQELVSKL